MTAAPHHDSVPHDVVHGCGHTDLHATGTMVAVCYCYTQQCIEQRKPCTRLFSSEKKLSCTVSPTRSTIDYTLLEHPHSFHLTCFSLFFQHFPTHPQLSECDLPHPRHPSGWQYKACPMQRGAWIWTYLDTVDEMGFTGALLLRKHDETCSCHMFHKFP